MCGRYGQTPEKLRHYVSQRKLRALQTSIQFDGNKYLVPGNDTYSIGYNKEGDFIPIIGKFLYRPYYAPKLSWINARAEGKNGKEKLNEEDDPSYSGPYRLAEQSGSSAAVRKNRCIIPVDYFIEGSKEDGLQHPYLIRRKDQAPFGLAGFYGYTNNVAGICIVTTPAAELLHQVVKHHRSPFVLTEDEEGTWLDPELTEPEKIDQLFHPFDSSEFEAIKLADELPKGKINNSLKKILKEQY
ncbi:MAG: SOS response-associated peptidase family protein [Balneola sp.]